MRKKFDKLDSMIWFLTLGFSNEFPNSFLPGEVFIEGGVVYNCSFGELIYDLKNLRIKTIITDEDYSFIVNQGLKEYSWEKVYCRFHYTDGTFPSSKIKEYITGDWEKNILEEYEKRLG